MTHEEYQKVIEQYNEMLKSCIGIPSMTLPIQEAKMDFVSKAFISPAYTIKPTWHIPEGNCIGIGRVLQMHPFDFCVYYNQLNGDWNKALDMLRKYIHEKIDNR